MTAQAGSAAQPIVTAGVRAATRGWGRWRRRVLIALVWLYVAFLILALNLAGDGLRDVTDPRLRNR